MEREYDGFLESTNMAGERNRIERGTLYLVASPIGNLADISVRAVKVLSECSFIAAEDTRVTAKLLSYLSLNKPLISYHEHNKRSAGEEIVRRLKNGESCALVTDAGTPGISDPGSDISALCIERGISVTAVPGPCAAVNALILSGLDTSSFIFEGFLPEKKKEIQSLLTQLKRERRTMIFYSSPHDLLKVLEIFSEFFGKDRMIAICREMTKLNEEVLRGKIDEMLSYYTEHNPRGEYVIVVSGSKDNGLAFWNEMSIYEHVSFYESNGYGRMDAMKEVASDRGVAKNIIYKAMIERSGDE